MLDLFSQFLRLYHDKSENKHKEISFSDTRESIVNVNKDYEYDVNNFPTCRTD